MKNSAQTWYGAPDGSTLEFRVLPQGTGVLAPTTVTINGGKQAPPPDPIAGPVQVQVTGGDRIVVTIVVKFTDAQQVTAQVSGVLTPTGKASQAYQMVLSGSGNTSHQVKLIVLT